MATFPGLVGLMLIRNDSRVANELTYEEFAKRMKTIESGKNAWGGSANVAWERYERTQDESDLRAYRSSDAGYQDWLGSHAILMYSFPHFWARYLEEKEAE